MNSPPLILVLCCAFLTCVAHGWSCSEPSPNSTSLTLTWLQDSPLAVCNDGTPGGFYFKRGSDPSLWLVYLAGGDWCYDDASCAARALLPHVGNGGYNGSLHTSSKHFPRECPKRGVFSEAPGAALGRANKVYIPYCTSDAHMGDRAASEHTAGWHFRGREVVRATLQRLQEQFWARERSVDLVFGGGSAGGRGAMSLLDWVAGSTAAHVRVRGFLDSNMWLDVSSNNASFQGFGPQTRAAYEYVNASGLSAPCAQMYKGQEWRCVFGQYRMPFVTTPYLITASQYDSWQLRFDVCDDLLGCVIPAAAMPYTDSYGMLVQQYMGGLPGPGLRNSSAVYSQACYNHHMSESDLFWSSRNQQGLSGNDALNRWLEAPAGYRWVDECAGYQCSSGCSA